MYEKNYYEIPEFWDQDRYLNSSFDRLRFEKAMELMPEGIGTVVDLGCGNGSFLQLLSDKKITGIGLERSKAAASQTKELAGSYTILGDLAQLPFRSRSVPLVSCLEVLEHLPAGIYNTSLNEISRVAEQFILISVPFKEKRIFLKCPNCGCRFNPTYHLNVFDENTLAKLFPNFTLAKYAVIRSDEVYFANYYGLVRAYMWLFNRKEYKMPARLGSSYCPACGFRGKPGVIDNPTAEKPSTVPAKIKKSLYGLLKRLPLKKYTAVIALYQKN
ncbi:MAG: methyltransferase domain-containing protein [Candidatus Edwardsbacteria bacterium]|nr:methyltransferase domain-containing protein [Candidatus Edwardsbacteria bacterium]